MNINTSTQRESKIRTVDIIFVIRIKLKANIFTMSNVNVNIIIIPRATITLKGPGRLLNTIEKNKIFIINKRRDFIIYSIKIVLFQAFY